MSIDFKINKICNYIESNTNTKIVLLRNVEVIQWLFGDLSFLPPIENKNKTSDDKKYKTLEDEWGRNTLKVRRPDLKLDGQWTNKFGEHICEELYMLAGKNVSKPENKNGHQPDAEVDDAILEAKAQTFYTSGTAGEKIPAVPFKYRNIPVLYSKPLKVVCMGGAEKICRENYGNLEGSKCDTMAKAYLQFYKEHGIEFVSATDILLSYTD